MIIKDADGIERGPFEQKIQKWAKIHICLVKELFLTQTLNSLAWG